MNPKNSFNKNEGVLVLLKSNMSSTIDYIIRHAKASRESTNKCKKGCSHFTNRRHGKNTASSHSSIGSQSSLGSCSVVLKRMDSGSRLPGFISDCTCVNLLCLSFISLKMRITTVFTIHSVIRIKRNDTYKTLEICLALTSTHKFSYCCFFMQEAALSSQLLIAGDINGLSLLGLFVLCNSSRTI